MSRFQLSINVRDVDEAVAFYEKLLGAPAAKRKPGYANFVLVDPPLKLVLIEGEGAPGTLNHVGIEVADTAEVVTETQRIAELGLPYRVDDTHTCCHATQDKVWSRDPDGVPWEIYTVLSDSEEFGMRAH